MKKTISNLAVAAVIAMTLCLTSCGGNGSSSAFGPLKDYAEAFSYGGKIEDFKASKEKLKEALEGREFAVSVENEAASPFAIEKPFVVTKVSTWSGWHNPKLQIDGSLKTATPDEILESGILGLEVKAHLYAVNGDSYALVGELTPPCGYDMEAGELPVQVKIDLEDNGKAQYPNIPLINLICSAQRFVVVYDGLDNADNIARQAFSNLEAERERVWPGYND